MGNNSVGKKYSARSHSKNTDKNNYDRDSINGRDEEEFKFIPPESEISISYKVS